MNLLFLRGQVPQDRDPQEIIFDTLEECDDVWTQLAYSLLEEEDNGEIWYWNGDRIKQWKDNFVERWIPSFNNASANFEPDIIFCRGGFGQYHCVLEKYPDAFKIYYGAGERFLPQQGFEDYDLILQDSLGQLEICRNKYSNIKSELFIKPAVDNLFKINNVNKEFDVCFPANGTQERIKGHEFVFSTFPKELKILNLGNAPRMNKVPPEIVRKRVIKSEMPTEYQRCKMGIVCCDGGIDSCPRVIPEMLACGLPIVVLEETRFWKEKYIKPSTGIISNKELFWDNVRYVLNNLGKFTPREYYKDNLSMKCASKHIKDMIERYGTSI